MHPSFKSAPTHAFSGPIALPSCNRALLWLTQFGKFAGRGAIYILLLLLLTTLEVLFSGSCVPVECTYTCTICGCGLHNVKEVVTHTILSVLLLLPVGIIAMCNPTRKS